ncbi:MAG: phosphate acyltransferase PlsX [Bacteroidota bacterium]
MKIALDAMGGDFAPEATVEGALMAVKFLPPQVKLVLVGKEPVIQAILNKHAYNSPAIEIFHAEEVIDMGEHPTKALSQKPNSSIAVGFKLLKSGEVSAFCSAGNTGAMHVGAMFSIKAIEGVMRPAIAGFAPQIDGSHAVILDVGANADCKPDVLQQFAEIGSVYATYVLGIKSPKVALMNLGEEEQKGSLATQAAYQLLKINPKINFIGNIEGRDLFINKADVIVCDGFTGNVILKLAESIYDLLKQRNISDPFFNQLNYESVGGSPILGVNGNVIIGHGVSSPLAIQNMIVLANKMVQSNIYTRIREALV